MPMHDLLTLFFKIGQVNIRHLRVNDALEETKAIHATLYCINSTQIVLFPPLQGRFFCQAILWHRIAYTNQNMRQPFS